MKTFELSGLKILMLLLLFVHVDFTNALSPSGRAWQVRFQLGINIKEVPWKLVIPLLLTLVDY